jgi:hypothetical protein
MKNIKTVGMTVAMVVVALLWGPVPRASGSETDPNPLKLDVYGRSQMIGVGEIVTTDPFRDDTRIFLFMKQARLGFKGLYGDVKFDMQFAFGGESLNGSNTDLSLLDFVVDVPLASHYTSLKIGQFRVPYSREGLTDRGYINFGERSIMNMASYQSRDYGLAIQRHEGTFAGTFGVFSSGGRDVPQRYLPEVLGIPEMVARVGYNDGVDQDIYHVMGTDINLKRTTKALYLNALYTKDTLIGHSTTVNVRTIDKNLLVDPNYNQFITAGPNAINGTATTTKAGDIWFVGGDAVLRHPLGDGKAIGVEAEINYGSFSNEYGDLHIAAGRLQGIYLFGPYELGLRYAALHMDTAVRFRKDGKIFDPKVGKTIHEITPSVTWYMKGHNMKIVVDAPVYLNMPVFIEDKVGSYVFVEQPGQVSYLATVGSVDIQTVVQGRVMFQFMF